MKILVVNISDLFKSLFWKIGGAITELIISIINGVYFWGRPC